MYSYQIFAATDKSSPQVEKARKSFDRLGVACYLISKDGRPQQIQFEGEEPHPGKDLEDSAKLHIAAIEQQESAPAEPTFTAAQVQELIALAAEQAAAKAVENSRASMLAEASALKN